MSTINERIKELIESKGLNPNSFAVGIGMKDTPIRNIINGRNKPSFDVLKKIITTHSDISPLWLINGTGPMELDRFQQEIDYIKGDYQPKSQEILHLEIKLEYGKVVEVNQVEVNQDTDLKQLVLENHKGIRELSKLIMKL